MYARSVDDAAEHLRELRHEEWGDLGLGVLALCLAAVAAETRPELALPLFVGGVVVWALGVRALWRRWDLVDRLAGDEDAYVISEVRAYASREATIDRRRSFAALIRDSVREAGASANARTEAAVEELRALASELEDENVALDPAAAVACLRLLSDLDESPLLNPELPVEDLRSRVRQIRSGFTPRRLVT